MYGTPVNHNGLSGVYGADRHSELLGTDHTSRGMFRLRARGNGYVLG
jgi:hypothetical protein